MSKGGSGRNVPSMASIDGTSHERPPATRQPGAAGLRAALGILLLWLPATQALAEAGADPLFGTNGVAAVIEDGRPVAGWSAVPGGGFVAAGRPRFTARHTVDQIRGTECRNGDCYTIWCAPGNCPNQCPNGNPDCRRP